MSDLSASDVLAMSKDSGFLEGNGIIILILFFLIFGWGGGWGNNNNASTQGALTRAELYDGLNSQNIFSEFRSMQNDITNGFANVNQSLCAGFSGVNQSINNALATSTLAMNNGFNSVNQGICNLGYEMAQQACGIKNAIHEEGEATRALVTQNTIQDLRDKVADKDRELNSAIFAASQLTQTNNLETFMRSLINGGCSCGA